MEVVIKQGHSVQRILSDKLRQEEKVLYYLGFQNPLQVNLINPSRSIISQR